jgi:2'-5' RNA ligase
MPRIFTAIEIPEPVKARLSMYRGSLRGARWVEAEDYHLTLRFFGDVERRTAREIEEILGGIDSLPFSIELSGLSAFGGDRPRAIVALATLHPSLIALQAGHEMVARSAGLAPETRKFTPHVTLARLKGTRPGEAAEYLSLYGGLASLSFEVERVVLMSSKPGTGGGPYVVEAAFPLAGMDDEVAGDEADWT